MKAFPHYQQQDTMDCGPTCLRMVAKYYKKNIAAQVLRDQAEIGKDGVNLLGIAQAAEKVGFKTLAVKLSLAKLQEDAPMPCIVHWAQNHFVVVYAIKKGLVSVADPSSGLIQYSFEEFQSQWASSLTDGQQTGVALLLEPTVAFYQAESGAMASKEGRSFGMLFSYLFKYKTLLLQLALGLVVGSAMQLMLPFLTQSVVDTGIQTRNLSFIYLVLVAQLMLFAGRIAIDMIRSWILLHISTRINLSILSDFLIKLLKLPVSYFESKQTGDILQRINDHGRIESFLTGTSLNTLFSMFNLLVFGAVLANYNATIFGIFMGCSVLYSAWIMLFLKYRREFDQKRFALNSQNQSSLIQLVQAVPELKLNNATLRKRWAWENIQVQSFRMSIKSLALQQYQQVGAMVINEGKNIFITFLAASAVINGQMTLGSMMALQYIIGQLNSPVEQLVGFVQHLQDAKMSLERLNEVHEMEDEETPEANLMHSLPENRSLSLENVTYTYPSAGNEPVLKNVSMHIPAGKLTAIVGSSGSGKTTLIKLLLKFVNPQKGQIKVGNANLAHISHNFWRDLCGTVMQDGFIFSDTIANNIAISDESPKAAKLLKAVKVANIQDFIEGLPMSYNTKIGAEGNGISQGQRQRLLIARAVYKNPDYLFFDEATNALDAENERVILENLQDFFNTDGKYGRKTVVVVAHRLSTVKNADQIIVLEKGEVVEVGTHATLSQNHQGRYYDLVKNQLELGN